MTALLDHLVAGPGVAGPIRERRAGVLRHTEQVHRVLIEVEDDRFTHADRVGLALTTASEIADPVLVDWFTELAEDAGPARPEVVADWLGLITTMTHRPRQVDAAMIDFLTRQQGADRVVVVAQLVSYLAYLSRLVLALSAGPGGDPSDDHAPGDGRAVSTVTMRPRRWEPYLAPIPQRRLTDAEQDAFATTAKGAEKQDYYRVLVRDPGSLRERSQMYNLIMYDEGGLPAADREFAALWTSLRNGCPYCASVHARRLQTHTDRAMAESALTAGHDQHQSHDQYRGHDQLTARQSALATVAEALTDRRCGDLVAASGRARAEGLDELEVFDLVAVVAVFGWANRLMLALGSSSER